MGEFIGLIIIAIITAILLSGGSNEEGSGTGIFILICIIGAIMFFIMML